MPKAYIIFLETFHENVENHRQFDEYRHLVVPTLQPFDGRFIIRGGHFSVVEGDWPHERCVVVEFPSREKAEGWYWSPEYRALLPLRLAAMQADAIIIDGNE